MIDLNNCCNNIPEVAEEWAKTLYVFLFEKHKKKLSIKNGKKVVASFDTYYSKMKGEVKFNNDLDDKKKRIVLNEIRRFRRRFGSIVLAEEELNKYSKRRVSEIMKNLMVKLYKDFTQNNNPYDKNINNAHYFFRKLNIRTCPYCNRHYTFTLSKKNTKVSPEYDHFYDKSSHPLLAVSFYNLVPSCHTCNHVKGTKDTAKINPYFSGFKSKFMLYDKKGDKLIVDYDKVSIKKKRNEYGKLVYSGLTDEEKGNVETFGLQGLYEMHDDYINELLDKIVAYNPTVRQVLADAFEDQAYSPQQVYDFVWGRYLEEAQYGKRPLSKLTKDILEQLDILPDNDFQ